MASVLPDVIDTEEVNFSFKMPIYLESPAEAYSHELFQRLQKVIL